MGIQLVSFLGRYRERYRLSVLECTIQQKVTRTRVQIRAGAYRLSVPERTTQQKVTRTRVQIRAPALFRTYFTGEKGLYVRYVSCPSL